MHPRAPRTPPAPTNVCVTRLVKDGAVLEAMVRQDRDDGSVL